MTRNIKSKGFTIVELLIVIVVIAILAAITIVAYNGIQSRARNSAAQSAAETMQKKIEAFNSVTGAYPVSGSSLATQLNGQNESSLNGANLSEGTPTSSNGTNTVLVKFCTAPTAATGYQIFYYDFTAGSVPSTPQVQGGTNGTTCTTWTGATA